MRSRWIWRVKIVRAEGVGGLRGIFRVDDVGL